MDLSKLPRGVNWDDAYIVDQPVGQGSMAFIFRASVNLAKFDFATLISYWEAQKENVAFENIEAYCKYRRDVWNSNTQEQLLAHCRENQICFPDKQICALKILKEQKHTERFLTEWQKTIGLSEPHLLEVYGGGIYQGVHYYSMEYIDNSYSLEQLYELSLREKIELILQAAKGLAALHKMQVVHRDVKVDNFIVYRRPEGLHLKIADLGIAKNNDANYTRTNQVLGTPNFMAPEQVKSSKSANYLSDVYSLGATLYELISQTPPYAGQSLQTILKNINDGVAPTPVNKITEVPHEVNRIVKYLMAFKPSGRPQSMTEVGEILQDYLDGKTMSTSSSTEKKPRVRKKTTKGIPIQKTRNRTAAYKKSALDSQKTQKEMYFKLAAILLCPLLLILYLLFPELITAKKDNDNRGLPKKEVEVINIQPTHKKKVSLEDNLRNQRTKRQIFSPKWSTKGQWKQDSNSGSWRGFSPYAEKTDESSLRVVNFPVWKDYKLEFNVKLMSGALTLHVRELKKPIVLTEVFGNINAYPTTEFRITMIVAGRDLLIDCKLASSSLTTAPEKLRGTKSMLRKISRDIEKKVYFQLDSQGRFPASVAISQFSMRKISD